MNNEKVLLKPLTDDEYKEWLEQANDSLPLNAPLGGSSSLQMAIDGVENVKIKIVETNKFYDEV